MRTQIDIFGNEILTDQAYQGKPKETIHSRWRKMYGVDARHRCGDCQYCETHKTRKHIHYKCVLMGVSEDESTDIMLRNPSCSRFKNKTGGENNE